MNRIVDLSLRHRVLVIGLAGALGGRAIPCALRAAGSLALFATHRAGARYLRLPPWYGLLFPLGYTVVAAIVLNSLHAYRAGAVRWKGRTYAPCGEEAASCLSPTAAAGEGGRGER